MVTIKDIANKLDISISTVSKGLNGASDISEEMRQLVLDTAVELGYVIKRKKKTVTQKICIMVENMDYENINQFGYEIITSFRLAASKHHYEVSLIPIDLYMQSKQTYDDLMIKNGYSGAFFLGFELGENYLEQLEHTKIPTVLFDNYVPNKKVGYIGTDSTANIHQIVKLLYDNGHRKIALLGGSKNSYVANVRYKAFKEALKSYDLPIDPALISFTGFGSEGVKDVLPTFIQQKATAIVCAGDLIAASVINELYHLDLKVPDDISVTGYDDLPIAKYLAPPLTTIRQERFLLGRLAFQLLEELISEVPVSTCLLHGELIQRDTVGKAKISR